MNRQLSLLLLLMLVFIPSCAKQDSALKLKSCDSGSANVYVTVQSK